VIEERFEVTLQREQVAELRTVGDVADLVVRLAG
jgi:acyl carrier protein